VTQDNAATDILLTSFETWLKGRGRSAHSLRAYRSDVSQFTTWFHQHTQELFSLAAVTDQDVVDWVDHLSRVRHAMPATVNRKLAALSAFFRWALEAKLVPSDPTANINGVDMVTAATFLGHSRLDTTARYSRPSEDDLARAAERVQSA